MSDEKIDKKIVDHIIKNSDKLFKLLLAQEDMFTLHYAKKCIKLTNFLHRNCTAYYSDTTATYLIYMAVNLGIVTYQYAYATWFLYLTTTFSGLKKLYKVVFKNPILGIFFYVSFYAQALGDADKHKFDLVSKKLGFPLHEDLIDKKYLGIFTEKIGEMFNGTKIQGYKLTIKQILRNVAGIMLAQKIEGLGPIIVGSIEKSSKDIENLEYAAIVLTNRDVFEEAEYDEWVEYTKTNKTKIQKSVKIPKKHKKKYKMQLQKVIERKNNGKIICQDECKKRTKTSMGCFCESDCGASMILGGKEWCYVDPQKCEKAKKLPSFLGKKYDFCNSSKLTEPRCYTGTRYKKCGK